MVHNDLKPIIEIVKTILVERNIAFIFKDDINPTIIATVPKNKKVKYKLKIVFLGHDITISLSSGIKVNDKYIQETYKYLSILNELCYGCFFHINFDTRKIEIRYSTDNYVIAYDNGRRLQSQTVCGIVLLNDHYKSIKRITSGKSNTNKELRKYKL